MPEKYEGEAPVTVTFKKEGEIEVFCETSQELIFRLKLNHRGGLTQEFTKTGRLTFLSAFSVAKAREEKIEKVAVQIVNDGRDWPTQISAAIGQFEQDGWKRASEIPRPESSERQSGKTCFIFNIRFYRFVDPKSQPKEKTA